MTPLESARERLRAALEAGEDTSAHREAIRRLESDAARRAGEESVQRAEIEVDRRRAVAARTDAILAEAQSSVDAALAELPKIPVLEP